MSFRAAREREDGGLVRLHRSPGAAVEARVMDAFVDAWEAVDVPRIVSLLADDALLTMPPEPLRIVGTEEIGAFFATVPAQGNLGRIKLVPAAANRQPTLAAYLADDEGGPPLPCVLRARVRARGGEDRGLDGVRGIS